LPSPHLSPDGWLRDWLVHKFSSCRAEQPAVHSPLIDAHTGIADLYQRNGLPI
jgi:hypothetical protein